MLVLTTLTFGLALWLGLYLIARNPYKALLRRVGFGLLAYAAALACDLLRVGVPAPLAQTLGRLHGLLVFVPAICWFGATLLLLPETTLRTRIDTFWRWVLAPLTGLLLLIAVLSGALDTPNTVGPVYIVLAALVLLPLCAILVTLIAWRQRLGPAPAIGLVIAATLFFGLGAGLLLFPLGLVDRQWMTLGIGIDLALLGLATALFDAFEEGERLRYDLLRSLIGAGGAALIFGGQIGLALLLGAPETLLTPLLLGIVTAAIVVQTLAGPIQMALDRLAFQGEPQLQQARAELQTNAEILPRVGLPAELAELSDIEFVRLTRRALSSYGDLARLAANPLTRLPAVDARLSTRSAPDNPLVRAAELRQLLAESVARLKPRSGDFGTTDEWRHYNALYFPYIVGIRPYSRRAANQHLDATAQQALDWMAAQVPERTLYNWQKSAARLVAGDLRSHLALFGSDSGSESAGVGSVHGRILSSRNTPPTP